MKKPEKNFFDHTPDSLSKCVRENRIAEEKIADRKPADKKPTNRKSIKEGSPFTKLCTHSEMSGTAAEQLSATGINTTDDAGMPIYAGPVPLFLVPKTLSREIQAHGGDISDIAIHRTGYHIYSILITKTPKQGCSQGNGTQGNGMEKEPEREHGQKLEKRLGREHSQNPGGADAD